MGIDVAAHKTRKVDFEVEVRLATRLRVILGLG